MHSFFRTLVASLVALPLVAQAWAPLYTTASDAPCTWPQPATVTLVGNFVGKADPAGTTWNNIVAEAAAAWNTHMKDAQLVATEGIGTTGTRENGVNELFFADTAFGFEFGDATSLSFVAKHNDRLVESDVVFKRSHAWDAAGFRTAATHELGHTLGLGHPDQAGQTVVALMNGNSVNSLTLAADDIAGIQFLYGAPPQPPAAPAITTQPASRSALLGSSVSFTITANGFPIPTFQWQKDGAPIPGATAATLTIFPVAASDAGAYRVVATNSEGAATSAVATLAVNVPPTIVSAPVARIVPVGETVTFSVIAAGDAPLSYQWAFNGADIPGATAASHAVSVSDVTVGIYRVMVTNPFGSAAASATLAIQPPFSAPAITTQPADLTVNAGATATFTVEATGFPRPVCQWQKDGVTIAGVLGTTLVLDNVQASQAGNYRAVLTNSAGSVTSDVATLIVNTQGPAITTQPADLVATEGTAVELAVVATGFPPPSYRWSKDGRVLAGATSAKLVFASIGLADAGLYSVEVYNGLGAVTSRTALLSVNRAPAAPVITVQPPNRTVSLGGDVSFAVVATGYPAPTYQWYKSEAPILNATDASLVITNAQASDAAAYYVIATNASGTARSQSATLVVSAEPSAPRISAQPQSQVSPVGANVTFTVVADGLPKPTYQWKKDGLNITGATGASLVIPGVQTGAAGAYTVVVTNSHGQLVSDTATLIVHTAPTIVTQPVAQTVAAGTPVSFTVAATGIPAPTYQWRKSGVAIPGATEATLAIANAQPEHAGNYVVVVTNSSGTVTSNSVALTVNTPPAIGTEPADLSVLAGTAVDFAVVATGTAPLTYQWYLNGAIAEGHNGASFGSFNASGYHDGYTFKCVVTNALGFATSRTATLHVGVPTAPAIATEPADVIAQVGDTADFVVEATGVPDPTYRWYLNGVLAVGHTEAAFGAFTVDGFHDNYTFRCVVTNPSGSVSTRLARLYVGTTSAPAVLAEPVDLQAKVGDTVDFTASFSGLPPPTYRWEMNGNPAEGRTAANFGAFKVEAYHNGYTFRCVATNSAGTTSTRVATLTVATPAAPTITTQPADRTVKLGDTVDFSVVATGYPAPTYQWYLNGTLVADRTGPQFGSFTADGYHNGYTFACVVTNELGSVTSHTAKLLVAFPPKVTVRSTGVAVTDGQPTSLVVDATGATHFQWFRGGILVADQWYHGGVLLADGHSAAFDIPAITPAHAGLYDCMVGGPGGDVLSAPIVVGVLPATGQRTAGSVATRAEWQNLRHASGAILDQFLLSGAAGTFTADPGEVARMSFLDENDSIVQVELSGAGAITVVLDGAVGPQAPALYNQPGIGYMKGKATVILAGANETTHFTIYSVGTATNPGVTRPDADYVGWADVAAAGIVSTDGKLGGIHQGNVAYSSDLGPTGLYAPSVTKVVGNVVVHSIAASESAQSYLQFAPTGEIDVLIAGSNLAQGNDGGIVVDGIHRVLGNAGQDSCGRNAPPQNIATKLFNPEGEDVTEALFFPVIIVGPGGLPPPAPIVPEPEVVPGS